MAAADGAAECQKQHKEGELRVGKEPEAQPAALCWDCCALIRRRTRALIEAGPIPHSEH